MHRVLRAAKEALSMLVLLLCFSPACPAAETSPHQDAAVALTEQERAWIAEHPALEVVTDSDNAPYGFIDEQGSYVGVIPDIAARIARMLGIRIQFKPVSYSTLIDRVREGAVEAAALVDPLDVSVEAHYLMTDEVLFMPYGLFVRTDSELAQHTPETITGKTIALIDGWDLKNPGLDPLRNNRFVFADTYLEAITLVLNGRADAFFDVHAATSYLLARNFIKDIKPVRIYHQGYPAAFFIRRQHPELHSALQKALAAIPRQERMKILQKWNVFMDDTAASLTMLDLLPRDRAWLKEHPVIRVGIDANWAPVEFMDSDGLTQGIAIDYLRQFESMLGIRFNILADRPWSDLRDTATHGTVDVLSGVVKTPRCADLFEFTRPYIEMPVVILTRPDIAYVSGPGELEGRRVAVVRGYALEEWLARDYPGIEVVPAESVQAMFGLLNNNEVYACMGSLPAAGCFLSQNPLEEIKVSGQTPYTYRVSMAVRRDYAPLAAILQKALDAIPPEKHAQMQRRWMALPHAAAPDYSLLLKIVLPLLAALLVVGCWALLLARQISSRRRAETGLRTAQTALEKINAELESRVRQRTLDLEKALRDASESQTRFSAIAENSPDAILITDMTTNVLYCNNAAERMFGYEHDQFIGRPAIELVPERMRPGEAEGRQQYIATGDSDFMGSTVESWAVRRDGTEFPIEFSIFGWEAGDSVFFGTIIRDISLRRQAETALRTSQERFSSMAENIQEGLAIVENGEIVYWNRRMPEILGYPGDTLPRFDDLDFFEPDCKQRLNAMLEQARATGRLPTETEFWVRHPDGSRHCIQNRYAVKPGDDGFLNRYVVCTDITDRKLAEEALQQERARLTRIIMTSPIVICSIAADGAVNFINAAGEETTGYTLEELKGRNWWQTFYPGQLHAQADRLFEEFSRSGDVVNYEMTMQTKAGALRTIMWNSMSDHAENGRVSEIFGFGIDITERTKAEDEVRQARDYLRNIFRASPDAILVADPEGVIITANESVKAIYGYAPEEIIGQHSSVLVPRTEQAMQENFEVMEQLFEKGSVRVVEGDRVCKDGRIIQVESSIVLLKNPDGSVAGAISSSRDVTDRKKLEEQLRQSQKMESIGTLAGGIAHDFNNILGVIFGYAELSQELAAGSTPLANNLAQILKAAERARNLVRQILAFSRKSTFEAVPLRMHLIIKEALSLLRASLPSSIAIQSNVAETNDTVMADATQIHQVIINLCTNAAHAMHESGGTLDVTLKPVELDTDSAAAYSDIEPGAYVHLSVRDTGTGIAPDIIGRIFEPFFTTKTFGSGTGMGLSVVHGIVKSLKGDIKVYSRPGSGTVFHIMLPRVRDGETQKQEDVPEAPRGHESILLVDDEQMLLDVGMRLLNSLGYTVTALHNPAEALELFRQDPAAFDAVITDQTMPGMTGFELARRLLAIRPGIPVILCTGYSDLVTGQSARSAGISDFIHKPLDRTTMAHTLRRILEPPRTDAL